MTRFDAQSIRLPRCTKDVRFITCVVDVTGYAEDQFAARYDLVIHLVSTAHGAESVYEQEFTNNPARTETAQEARELDDKVFVCWSKHSNHLRLDNSTSFEAKIAACGEGVLKMINGA